MNLISGIAFPAVHFNSQVFITCEEIKPNARLLSGSTLFKYKYRKFSYSCNSNFQLDWMGTNILTKVVVTSVTILMDLNFIHYMIYIYLKNNGDTCTRPLVFSLQELLSTLST